MRQASESGRARADAASADGAPVPRFTPAPPAPPGGPAGPGQGWPGYWPRESYLELAALDTAPGSARAHVGAVLWEWSLGDIADDGCLVVSELVTNAVLSARAAGRHDPVRMWVLGDGGGGVLFVIWDATMPGPLRRVASVDAEHGRGLNIVDALSASWGSYEAEGRLGGKVVWALLASGGDVSERLEGRGPAGLRDEGPLAPAGRSAPALPVRRAPVSPLLNGARARHRTPVAPHILARVKEALERLDDHRGRAGDAG